MYIVKGDAADAEIPDWAGADQFTGTFVQQYTTFEDGFAPLGVLRKMAEVEGLEDDWEGKGGQSRR